MTTYSWTVARPSAGVGGAGRAGAYAYTPAFDPATREHVMLGSQWAPGDPMAEVVAMTLATPKGTFLPDPTLGPDYALLRKQAPNTAALWRASVLEALARYVAAKQLVDLVVTVDPPRKGRVVYAVDYTDPRASTRLRTTLRLVATAR